MAHEIFISYSVKDKEIADAICTHLEARGLPCWVAPRDILPGVTWGEAIVNAIHESKVMVLVLSSSSNDSGQVLREVERAVSEQRGLVSSCSGEAPAIPRGAAVGLVHPF